MKLSNKGRYGVRALYDIAFYNHGRPTQIREIAERSCIPARFLEQIFQDLKRAGIVGAKRGPKGGYHLARLAKEISIGDVMRALEGPVVLLVDDEQAADKRSATDATASIFRDIAKDVEHCFDSVSIEDVCERGRELREKYPEHECPSYVI